MGLGPDNKICKLEFMDQMRPIAGKNPQTGKDNVEDPQVEPNFGALGQALYNIATLHAEVTIDSAFWEWIKAIDTWQQGVTQAFKDWQPTQDDGQKIKEAVLNVRTPTSSHNPLPATLKGKII